MWRLIWRVTYNAIRPWLICILAVLPCTVGCLSAAPLLNGLPFVLFCCCFGLADGSSCAADGVLPGRCFCTLLTLPCFALPCLLMDGVFCMFSVDVCGLIVGCLPVLPPAAFSYLVALLAGVFCGFLLWTPLPQWVGTVLLRFARTSPFVFSHTVARPMFLFARMVGVFAARRFFAFCLRGGSAPSPLPFGRRFFALACVTVASHCWCARPC